ncbi:hypothetical protein FC52_GL000884 [Lactobacillus pasteurii DSM 23907 = CRBIP 24.76]|uniref:Uncharacterized protein n=1 Tax=Lactobacillus pasteurii DSM 23907 = CRBIP 24.76 TaxID=1423790 RepID=I7LB72_9LACO|nr:hypothetical protein [Lactobacillus pasteurii]KRK07222.1 hypothetical protein FC52_GL000884 [Lactobacillus pasteurii DSM 23907 = CRBIP 24.76]TDG76591.1 hypothetical protein C5L33_001350 [Lactobacillus pasteurii]CCI85316.1 Protein of unknown function [Lactobacillus pasteurii DSM 23907 = CRBIP 24.76]
MFGFDDDDFFGDIPAPKGSCKLDYIMNDVCDVISKITFWVLVIGGTLGVIEQVVIAITNAILKAKGLR